ncbi:hypothetical protein D3C86_2227790 [compost metagenome]
MSTASTNSTSVVSMFVPKRAFKKGSRSCEVVTLGALSVRVTNLAKSSSNRRL